MMTRRMMVASALTLSAVGVAAGVSALRFSRTAVGASAAAGSKPQAILYRNPNCGCCLEYAKYLRGNGFEVTVDSEKDLASVRKQLRVPEKFEGCHVMTIGRYAVEGHVSAGSVNKLLTEHPNIIGISIPGMPAGTPGMTGWKAGPLTVYEIGNETGPTKVFAVE